MFKLGDIVFYKYTIMTKKEITPYVVIERHEAVGVTTAIRVTRLINDPDKIPAFTDDEDLFISENELYSFINEFCDKEQIEIKEKKNEMLKSADYHTNK